ncbi:MAG: hypothetical protein IJH31_05595 [Erysipelotrichaceae bacterium]|nr:hypothetical protein [Erysipelotrichaceae bacterium]
MDIIKRIRDIGLIPNVDYCDCLDVNELRDILNKVTLPIIEFDGFNKEAIECIKKENPNMIVGIGYLEEDEIDEAIKSGVDFISPINLSHVKNKNILVIPEFRNVSEEALKELTCVKVKKAEIDKALSINNNLKLIVRGLAKEEINNCLKIKNVIAYEDIHLIDMYDLSKLENDANEAINNLLNISIKHIGLNEDNGNALELAKAFAKFFNGNIRQTSKGYFGSELVEIMNTDKAKGYHGHIGLTCDDVDRCYRYYKDRGYEFDEDSATYNDDGTRKFIYFKNDIGGFAIHFVK